MLDFLEGNDDAIPDAGLNIAVLPPSNATADLTDEDSGGEEDPVIDNVPPNQLNTMALAPDYVCDQMREQHIIEEIQAEQVGGHGEEADHEMENIGAESPRRRRTARRRVQREGRKKYSGMVFQNGQSFLQFKMN